MLIIISQVVLLLAALALPLKNKRERVSNRATKQTHSYRIDTDTSKANYAINEFGTLERINRVNWDEKPEFEN